MGISSSSQLGVRAMDNSATISADNFQPLSGVQKTKGNYLTEDSIFAEAIALMFFVMDTLSFLARQVYNDIMEKSNIAYELQEHNAKLNAIVSKMTDPKQTENIDTSTIKTINDCGLVIKGTGNGQDIFSYILGNDYRKTYPTKTSKELSDICATISLPKEKIVAIQAAVESAARRATDFSANAQLRVSQLTNQVQTTFSMITSMQSSGQKVRDGITQRL